MFEDFNLTEKKYEDIKNKIKSYNERIAFYENRYKGLRDIFGLSFISIIIAIAFVVNFKLIKYPVIQVLIITFIFSGILFVIIEKQFSFMKRYAKNKVNNLQIPPSEHELKLLENYEESINTYKLNYDKYEWELSEFNRNTKAQQSEYWFLLNGWNFESQFEKILIKNGFITYKTSGSSDGGIDIFATKDKVQFAIQCKAHKNQIGPSVIRDLYGAMNHNNIKNGILVNLGGFTKGVIKFAKDKSIILLDINDVIELHVGKKTLWKF
ncbi:MAG: restriction endonuclease [Ignavibacterium sp.]|nr:restriction endonuclease [Ignavibacterium sp.]